MSKQTTYNLEVIRHLNKESNAGLLFSYKALKHFEYNYDKALAYLESEEFKFCLTITMMVQTPRWEQRDTLEK